MKELKKVCPICKRRIPVLDGKFASHGQGFSFCKGSREKPPEKGKK